LATVTNTIVKQATSQDAYISTWATMLNGDSGLPLQMPAGSDRSVQITGTFGSGGTCVIEGSNDGTNYYTLNDPLGNALSATTARLKAILEVTGWIRPRISAGDGTTSLTVSICTKGNKF
jgi:hypothetical protein